MESLFRRGLAATLAAQGDATFNVLAFFACVFSVRTKETLDTIVPVAAF